MTAQMNVLVIDDDTNVLDFFQVQLARLQGYEFNLCPESKLGLQALSDNPPDILIIDWLMPGWNGIDILREVGKNPDIDLPPFVAMISAAPDLELLSMIATELGASEVLPKPLTEQVVSAMLRRAETRIATGV